MGRCRPDRKARPGGNPAMTKTAVLGAIGCAALALATGPPHDGPGARQDEAIPALIRQLGDKSFRKREQAGQRLAALGEPALPALRRAADTSRAPEIRDRA